MSNSQQSENLKKEIECLKKDAKSHEWGLKKTNEALKILYKDLEFKNQELKKLDQLKSDFVATVSHELRTPLAISTEGINLILDGIVGEINEQQRDLLVTSKENLHRLNAIITDLLDISKIEAGKIDLKLRLVDLKKILVYLTNAYKKVLDTKKQTLKTIFPSQDVLTYVDGDKIIQVVTNLLNNAHKFTEEGGCITLEMQILQKGIRCSVSDTGMGIAKDDIPKLFGKFQQFDRSYGPGIKGTGLGLAISKALVEMHGGRIWAQSEVGQGTTFHFTFLNLKSVQTEFTVQMEHVLKEAFFKKQSTSFIMFYLNNANQIEQQYGQKGFIEVVNSMLSFWDELISRSSDRIALCDNATIFVLLPETHRSGVLSIVTRLKESIRAWQWKGGDKKNLDFRIGVAVCPEEASDGKGLIEASHRDIARKKNILLVDDQPQIIHFLKTRLMSENFMVISASDGVEALEVIGREKPDLIVLDIMMPKMNGYEVLGRLKGNALTATIPVIFLTAKNVTDVIEEYTGIGNVPVMEKTGGFTELVEMIKVMV